MTPPTNLPESDRAEWLYVFNERLGIDGVETPEGIRRAKAEANRAVNYTEQLTLI